jgi:hypothetical protein
MNIVELYHPQLLQYKNKHQNQTCYIFGSGPTVNDFIEQEPGSYIGCNHIIKNEQIKNKLQYYFFGHGYMEHNNDNTPIYGNHKQEVDNLPYDLEKFAMVSRDNNIDVHGFTYDDIERLTTINALPCDINIHNINKDLEYNSFLNHSIVFPAIQFALYCGYTKIYLVGCDCNGFYHSNSYHNNTNTNVDNSLVYWWEQMYNFKQNYYPDVNINSINPQGLKNIMDNDIFTLNY